VRRNLLVILHHPDRLPILLLRVTHLHPVVVQVQTEDPVTIQEDLLDPTVDPRPTNGDTVNQPATILLGDPEGPPGGNADSDNHQGTPGGTLDLEVMETHLTVPGEDQAIAKPYFNQPTVTTRKPWD